MKRKHFTTTIVGITLAAVAAITLGCNDSPWHQPTTAAEVAAAPADSPWSPER